MIRRMKVMRCWKSLSIKVSERGGAYQKYIKDIEIPDTF